MSTNVPKWIAVYCALTLDTTEFCADDMRLANNRNDPSTTGTTTACHHKPALALGGRWRVNVTPLTFPATEVKTYDASNCPADSCSGYACSYSNTYSLTSNHSTSPFARIGIHGLNCLEGKEGKGKKEKRRKEFILCQCDCPLTRSSNQPPVFTYRYPEWLLRIWYLSSTAIFLCDGYMKKKWKKWKRKTSLFQFIVSDCGTGVCVPWLPYYNGSPGIHLSIRGERALLANRGWGGRGKRKRKKKETKRRERKKEGSPDRELAGKESWVSS